MFAVTRSMALLGLHAFPLEVEVEIARGVPYFEVVGLAEAAVRESRVRVRTALAQLGVDLSDKRVVVNLCPADIKKNSTAIDFAIATAILLGTERAPKRLAEHTVFLGELSLSGRLMRVRGVLPQAIEAKRLGFRRVAVPSDNLDETSLVEGIEIAGYETLADWLQEKSVSPRPRKVAAESLPREDFSEVVGHRASKRALEVAAAGAHNVLLVGPPGAGKTMLATRFPGILPPLAYEEAIEVLSIYSVSSPELRTELPQSRPFRSPHHTVSEVGLIGGGETARPGEISLAHEGVLFLDELAEFRRGTLDALRQPTEEGAVHLSRSNYKVTFPSRYILIGATNPCPCGWQGSPKCACSQERIRFYQSKLSGPLLDRIDLQVRLSPESLGGFTNAAAEEKSEVIRGRVVEARRRQEERQRRLGLSSKTNASLRPKELRASLQLSRDARTLLEKWQERHAMTGRAVTRSLKVALTLADLAGQDTVERPHLAEALGMRLLGDAPLSGETPSALPQVRYQPPTTTRKANHV